MPSHDSVGEPAYYAITEKGRYDLIFAEDCTCNPRLVGILIACPTCGTVYGSLSEALGNVGGSSKRRRP